MAKKWTTTETEDAIIHVSECGAVFREGMSSDQQHAFYGAYQPERVILHQSSLEEVLSLKRKSRQEEE
tara:strand:+ start:166 stop:369 length:204 start_codon:yes stop_codon:yes gene_type:complete